MTTEQIIDEVFRRVMEILKARGADEGEKVTVIEKRFVTEADLRHLLKEGDTKVCVPEKTVITDIALEYLAKRKIKVSRMSC